MHYGLFQFARNPDNWTIKPLDKYKIYEKDMGQRMNLTDLDANKVNTIYKCSTLTSQGPDDLTARPIIIPQTSTSKLRIQITQATTTEKLIIQGIHDDPQPYEPETTARTTTPTRRPKTLTITHQRTRTMVTTAKPDKDTGDRKQPAASNFMADKVGEEGERSFWWTGLPPDFYRPRQNAQEFYPWRTNGVLIFNGEKRIVSSGFRTGIYPNGSHWRTNWFKWQYPEKVFTTTSTTPLEELQKDKTQADQVQLKTSPVQPSQSDELVTGKKGSKTFWWTGSPPNFYVRPPNESEFYPWQRNGLVNFKGRQLIVSSGFTTGVYANGTKWRRNWYEWKYVN
jgi:hypothetical protein